MRNIQLQIHTYTLTHSPYIYDIHLLYNNCIIMIDNDNVDNDEYRDKNFKNVMSIFFYIILLFSVRILKIINAQNIAILSPLFELCDYYLQF